MTACRTSAPQRVAEFPDMHVEANPNATDAWDGYDAEMLYERGINFFDAHQFSEAIPYFVKVIDEFPESPEFKPAHYYVALSYIELEDGTNALLFIDSFIRLIPHNDRSTVYHEALLKRAIALSILQDYDALVESMETLIDIAQRPEHLIQAHTNAGIGLFMLERYDEASSHLLATRRLYRNASRLSQGTTHFFMAQATFYLAEISREEFERVQLQPESSASETSSIDMKRVSAQLEIKCQRLFIAQSAYFRVIREKHAGWAAASGFQIGRMYEVLYEDLIGLPLPEDLNEEERQLYQQTLHKRITILLQKAFNAWKANLDMATRTGTDNVWVQQTEERMERLNELLQERAVATPLLEG